MWPLALCFPVEVVRLIEVHMHAMCIQTRLVRWWLYSHARRREWDALRMHLGATQVALLSPYAQVRLEWRTEMASWMTTTIDTQKIILSEAEQGLWGKASVRLKQSVM